MPKFVRISRNVVRRGNVTDEVEVDFGERILQFRTAQAAPVQINGDRTGADLLEAIGVPVERDGGVAHGWRAGFGSHNARNAG